MKGYGQKIACFVLATVLWSAAVAQEEHKKGVLPEGFVYVAEVAPDLLLDIRYYSTYNFVGARVDGYRAPVAILTLQAALALKEVGNELRPQGYLLKIFDAYRPQQAVDHFARWAKDLGDTLYKQTFYPNIDKSTLFELGYIAARSGHSRGSAVDLTLVDILTGQELDMGTPFDFFGSKSGHGSDLVTQEQAARRELLKNTMIKYGFRPFVEEWWHYTFNKESYPDTYFNFEVAL